MNYIKFATLIGLSAIAFTSCNEESNGKDTPKDLGEDAQYYKSAVGNFTAEEWLPGGELGTTDNVTESSYQDASPAVEEQGLDMAFNFGEQIFERTYNQSQPPFNGLGPAWVRQACITCHPAYGHGKRQNDYKANTYGNGYLLVIFDKDTEAKPLSLLRHRLMKTKSRLNGKLPPMATLRLSSPTEKLTS